jgi:membrane protein DedA with SNARE-associated domain
MQPIVDALVANGYLVVFLWVFASQAGLPVPAIPALLAAGALVGTGHLDLVAAAGISILAALAGDSLWFVLGRHRGNRVLGLLCRLSLEPEACVNSTRTTFARHQGLTLVFAKFVPGLGLMAPPLAGMFGVSWPRFLLLDGFGAAVWTMAFMLPGYALSDRLEQLAENATLTGAWLLGLFAVVVLVVLALKFVRRRAFLRGLRVARIEPTELLQRLGVAEAPFLVDLRHALDFDADPRVIPGALRLAAEELERHHDMSPRDRDVVIYCT